MMTGALLQVSRLKKWFPIRRGILGRTTGYVRAVDGIDLAIGRGATLGLVGESGSGKTTAGLAILRLTDPAQGEVLFDGMKVLNLNGNELLGFRRSAQIIFQDPYSSLNPRMSVLAAIREPMDIRREGSLKRRNEQVKDILSMVGLPPNSAAKYPHELSGGQRQRVCIAKALASQPKFVVCDEPVSALDVSIRSQILNLLEDLKRTLDLTYLFISHDLSVVRHVCDEVAVMYLGRVVESARTAVLFSESLHPYTRALLSAIPVIGSSRKERVILTGELPSPSNVPAGCRFHPRCYEKCGEVCERVDPPAVALESGHVVACHRYA